MRVKIRGINLPGYAVEQCGEVFVRLEQEEEENGVELDEQVIREYAGNCAVYLEALAAFVRAVDEARKAAREPDVAAPKVE